MEDLQDKIIELMDLFDEGEVTTADKIERPQRALDREAIDDFMKRNPMAGGGMLVQPSADGSRPGYAKSKKKINRDESYRKVVKDFVATSGPGTGKIFDDPAAIEIVKANLNKIKKQRNNKALFEWSEDSDWYRKLRKELNPNTKTGTNREYTNKLINQVVDEFFPGAYHGKNAITNFRNDMVVKSFIQHLKSVGEFDGQEKFDKVLDQFTYTKDGKRKSADHLYESINKSWKSWINGEFEVDGVDRAQLKKELKARGIDYSQIDNWKAAQTQKRGTEKIAEIKFLDNQNSKFPNRSVEQVEELFKKKFPNGNFALRVNNLTEIKRNGVYISGANSERSITGIDKGDRAGWLKKAYGKQFAGNYSKIINAADQLAAAGETAKAERLYRAADKFFGPTGIVRKSAVGEAEHALARSFDFLNPDRQLAINSIVSGDLNQFKKNLFDIPVKRYFDEYNNPNTTKARRVELKNLIEERKKIMNSLTGGQKSGIVAGDIVNFRYGANKITATSSVKPIDTLFKEGKFNIDDYIERGNKYTEAFQTATKDINLKKDFSTPVNENKLNKLILNLAATVTDKCAVNLKADGGRIGYSLGSEACLKIGKEALDDGLLKGFKNKQQVNLAETILRAGGGLKSAFALRNIFGPAAVAATVAFEGGLIGYDMLTSGKTLREAFGDNLLNYALGKDYQIDPQEELFKRFKGLGYDDQQIGSIKRSLDAMNTINTGAQLAMDVGQQQEALKKSRGQPEPFMGPDDQMMADTAGQRAEQNLKDAKNQLAEFNRDLVRSGQQDELSRYIESGDYAKGFDLFEQAQKEANIQKLKSAGPEFMGSVFPKFEEQRQADINENLGVLVNPAFNIPGARDATFIPGKTTGGLFGLAEGGRAGYKLGKIVKIKPSKVRSDAKSIIDENIKLMKQMKETGEIDEISSDLNQVIKKALDEDLFDKKDRIVDSINISEAKKRRNYPYNMQVFEEPKNLDFYTAIKESNFRTKTGPYFDRIRRARENKAGGGLLKQAGDRSGPPPESGPNSQGLQGLLNRVKKG